MHFMLIRDKVILYISIDKQLLKFRNSFLFKISEKKSLFFDENLLKLSFPIFSVKIEISKSIFTRKFKKKFLNSENPRKNPIFQVQFIPIQVAQGEKKPQTVMMNQMMGQQQQQQPSSSNQQSQQQVQQQQQQVHQVKKNEKK